MIRDVHNLLLAVAELQERLVEAEVRIMTMQSEIGYIRSNRPVIIEGIDGMIKS